MSAADRQNLVVGLGVFAGLLFGYYAIGHFFVRGLDPDERKGMLKVAASAAIYVGVTQLADPSYQEYLDPLHMMTPEGQ